MRQHSALAAVLIIVSIMFGCDRSPQSASPATTSPTAAGASAGKKIKVALLPKKLGVPYFSTCADGAKAAAQELGNVELIYDGPTDGSAEKAAGMIEKWTLQNVDVIAVSPNDPDVLASAMKKARDKGLQDRKSVV